MLSIRIFRPSSHVSRSLCFTFASSHQRAPSSRVIRVTYWRTMSNPSSEATAAGVGSTDEPRKLILFFDGTGNAFTGSAGDTNVVKLLNKVDRKNPNQYHYYQTGIGTYEVNEKSVNKTWFGEFQSTISKRIDEGFGTSFDAHVMAGYRFLMRFYTPGAKIYMFGFSRGAYTAKFLARMVFTVGLLCQGNEEMVPFAYRLYQTHLLEQAKVARAKDPGAAVPLPKATAAKLSPTVEVTPVAGDAGPATDTAPIVAENAVTDDVFDTTDWDDINNKVKAFHSTFCRKEPIPGQQNVKNPLDVKTQNVKVYFLGIWDCVNSVAVLESTPPVPTNDVATASYVRHAVAVDEFRVKFKPTLLLATPDVAEGVAKAPLEDVKEVWFPGNHGDVGGGWPATPPEEHGKRKGFWFTDKARHATKDVGKDNFQLSDVPLSWMIRELELVGEKDPKAAVKWDIRHKLGFQERFSTKVHDAEHGFMHNTLAFGRGSGFFSVLFWKFLECCPFIPRYELMKGGFWQVVRWIPNMSHPRDIPRHAVLHQSLKRRLEMKDSQYRPRNDNGEGTDHCFVNHKGELRKGVLERIDDDEGQNIKPDDNHVTFRFKS